MNIQLGDRIEGMIPAFGVVTGTVVMVTPSFVMAQGDDGIGPFGVAVDAARLVTASRPAKKPRRRAA